MLVQVNDVRFYVRAMAEAVNHLPLNEKVWIQSQVSYAEFSVDKMAIGPASLTEFRFNPAFLLFYLWHLFIYSFITNTV